MSFARVNSELFDISQGVRCSRKNTQCLCFLVYFDDLLYDLCNSSNGVLLGNILHIPEILLSDDAALISSSPRFLQESLNAVESYAYICSLQSE